MERKQVWAGVSLGGKYTGDSALAIYSNGQILIVQPDEGVDSDAFSTQVIEQFAPEIITIDAPITIPGALTKTSGCFDYHFRQADKECGCISPMIIGGRTARAIELKSVWEKLGKEVYETSPRLLARDFGLREMGYRKTGLHLRNCAALLKASFNPDINLAERDISNWTRLDALLALMTAMKIETKTATSIGNPEEGLIWV
ncbi:MAG: hypothetical protein LAT76_08545 [Schleiferiaceae bacterium]|nr:hypothetical protein [Schleiferiaceae bacterium]